MWSPPGEYGVPRNITIEEIVDDYCILPSQATSGHVKGPNTSNTIKIVLWAAEHLPPITVNPQTSAYSGERPSASAGANVAAPLLDPTPFITRGRSETDLGLSPPSSLVGAKGQGTDPLWMVRPLTAVCSWELAKGLAAAILDAPRANSSVTTHDSSPASPE
ncbi:uncharacterized protein EI90DRAFT_3122144 [Cantharellus anzutake]|uniref:uncharacterized protein n=1 Tax=Cantharellus anzutake TaxID=1750568 RepID=UPI001905D29C|nr:uncharacterized protein EI90DRAFT_3122144 [Cantharellus anzutake]KAF8333099.1 hypothetical protein EI90DRAFT_3122144 [Cantharellus anzutake]